MKDQEKKESEQSERITEEIGYFKYSLEHAQKLVEFADSKASTLLTLHTVIVTIISAALFIDDIRLKIDSLIDLGILITIIVIILVSTGLLINVIRPREAVNNSSLFYYNEIAQFQNSKDYYSSFKKLSREKIAKSLANQAYDISRIASIKMRFIKYSLILLVIYLSTLILGSAFIIFI